MCGALKSAAPVLAQARSVLDPGPSLSPSGFTSLSRHAPRMSPGSARSSVADPFLAPKRAQNAIQKLSQKRAPIRRSKAPPKGSKRAPKALQNCVQNAARARRAKKSSESDLLDQNRVCRERRIVNISLGFTMFATNRSLVVARAPRVAIFVQKCTEKLHKNIQTASKTRSKIRRDFCRQKVPQMNSKWIPNELPKCPKAHQKCAQDGSRARRVPKACPGSPLGACLLYTSPSPRDS